MIQDSEDFNGIVLDPQLYAKLAKEYSHLVSVKVEGGNTFTKIRDAQKAVGDRLTIIGGMEAKQLLKELEAGAHGNIPDSCFSDLLTALFEKYRAGKTAEAENLFLQYKPWPDFLDRHAVSICEAEKELLRLRGVIKSSQTRSPHVPLDETAKVEIKELLARVKM